MGVLVQPRDLEAGPTLVFAPHGDDELLGCGGWLIRSRGLPVERAVVFCTRREPPRLDESLAALDGLRLRLIDLDLPERGRERWATPTLIARVGAIVDRLRPAYIFVPALGDPHPDHQQTHVLLHAVLGAGSSDPPPTIVQYEGLVPLAANWWLDISGAIAEKRQRLAAYRSQEQRYGLVAISEALSSYRGRTLLRSGIAHAESYQRLPMEDYLQCAARLAC